MSGIISPGRHFLIKESGGAIGAALPAADVTGNTNLTSTANGKVALVPGTSLLAGNCPGDDANPPFNPTNVADFAGYGGAATTAKHWYEGSAPAPSTLRNKATTANSDYVAKTLTNQIIPAGQTSYSFRVTINGDSNVEPDEIFSVKLSNVAGANLTGGPGMGTIQNDDFPTISINDVSLSEGDNAATNFDFTVSLSAPAPANVTFDIATREGTATIADNDYIA